MPRFSLPLTIDFTCRTNDSSTALSKATYIQNGFVRVENGVPMIYRRPALSRNPNQSANVVIEKIIGSLSSSQSYFALGHNSSDNTLNIYYPTTASPTSAHTVYKQLDTAFGGSGGDMIGVPGTGSTSQSFFATQFGKASGYWAYYYEPNGDSLTQMGTIANIPSSLVPGIAYLDTYVFVCGTIGNAFVVSNSNVGDASTWTALDYIEPELKGGRPLGIDTYKNHVIVFSSKNIQLFYDSGASTGSPLAPRKDLPYNFGLIDLVTKASSSANYSKAWWKSQDGETLAVLAQAHTGRRFVGLFNNFQVEKISNDFIDGLLETESDLAITGYAFWGKTFIHISIAGNLSLYYDLDTKLWHVFDTSISSFNTYIRDSFTAQPRTGANGNIILVDYNGKEYYFNASDASSWDGKTQDTDADGSTTHPINLVIQLPKYKGEQGYESQRKFMSELQLIADTQSSSDTISVQYSDDDYQTFSTARTIDMVNVLKQLNALGVFRERAFKFTYSGTNSIRLGHIEGYIRMGRN